MFSRPGEANGKSLSEKVIIKAKARKRAPSQCEWETASS